MNPEKPLREEIEARITALLLGELPAEEARLLRWTISQDAGLQKLHDELQSTIVLVREAKKNPADEAAEPSAPLKLSDDRRQKLLAHFKTPRPKESIWIRQLQIPSLIPVLVVVAIVALLAALMLPALSKSKSRAMHSLAANVAKQKALEAQIQADENPPTVAPATPAPVTVAVAPEPVLAPPPAPIVLPPTESTPSGTVITGSLADSRSGGVYSQNIVGYVNAPITAGSVIQATPATDSFALQDRDGGQPTALGDSPAAGTMTFSGGGGGGGGGGQTQSTINGFAGVAAQNLDAAKLHDGMINDGSLAVANSTKLAFDDSGANRSRAENKPAEVPSGQFPAGTAGSTFAQRQPETTVPQSIVLPTLAANDATDESLMAAKPMEKKYGSGTETTKGVSQLRNTPPASEAFKSSFSDKITPLPGQRAAIAESFDTVAAATTEKPAAAGFDMYLGQPNDQKLKSNNSWALSAPASQPAQERAPRVAGIVSDLGLQHGEVASNDSNGSAGTLFQNRITMGKDATVSFDTPVPSAAPAADGVVYSLATNTIATQKSESGSSTFAVSGVVQTEADFTDQTRRKLEIAKGATKAPLDAVKEQIAAAKQADFENAVKYQPYYAEKRKLLDLEETHKLLNLKLNANSIDAKIPTTSMVQLTDPAVANKKQTFWQGLKGEYASTATVKVESDGGIISGMNSQAATAYPYDPYFVQTTFEIMKSDAVLGQVVDAMKLDQAWSNKSNGEKLTKQEAITLLRSRLDLKPVKNTKLLIISATSSQPKEAADIANNVALAYQKYRTQNNQETAAKRLEVLQQQYAQEEKQINIVRANLANMEVKPIEEPAARADLPVRRPPANAPIPQPEILTRENAFSTFSLNVSDVSFKLAAASLEKGQVPDAASIRSEEFINAFDYRDPEAAAGQPMAFASERAHYPFAQNRDLLRFSIKTAAAGRPAGRALNLVLLLDNSGSMERADRVAIIREALHVLAGQLQPQDTVSVVTFARTARLWADGVAGDKAGETLEKVGDITPEGGTNLEEAMRLAYETARRHYLASGLNRVVLLTDGAANLGNVDPAVLKQKVEEQRKQGIALDCFGIGFEDYDDDLLEQLSRNGDGRYAFLNSPDDAEKEFAAKLAGALQIAASDVKVQVEFNPQRVISYRQIGYAKHQLTKEQFRDNTVDAAEIATQEAGNALYTVETRPDGTGPVATVHVRYKIPGTTDYRERSWDVAYEGNVVSLEQSSAAMRLAATASAFSEWLAASPFAQEVTPDELLKVLNGVPEIYGADERPKKLGWMIREAKSLSGK